MPTWVQVDDDAIVEINRMLKNAGRRMRVVRAYLFGDSRYVEAYTDRGARLVLPLAAGDEPNTYRVLSILKVIGQRARWLINGQPFKGTQAIVFFGWHKAPTIKVGA